MNEISLPSARVDTITEQHRNGGPLISYDKPDVDMPMNLPNLIVRSRTYDGPSGPTRYNMGYELSHFTRLETPFVGSVDSRKLQIQDRFWYWANSQDQVRGSIDGTFRPHPNDWDDFLNHRYQAEGTFDQCCIWDMMNEDYSFWLTAHNLSDTALSLRAYKEEQGDKSRLTEINIRFLEQCGYWTVYQTSNIRAVEHKSLETNRKAIILNGDPNELQLVIDELNEYIIKAQELDRARMKERNADPHQAALADKDAEIESLKQQIIQLQIPKQPAPENTERKTTIADLPSSIGVKKVQAKVVNNPNVAQKAGEVSPSKESMKQ